MILQALKRYNPKERFASPSVSLRDSPRDRLHKSLTTNPEIVLMSGYRQNCTIP